MGHVPGAGAGLAAEQGWASGRIGCAFGRPAGASRDLPTIYGRDALPECPVLDPQSDAPLHSRSLRSAPSQSWRERSKEIFREAALERVALVRRIRRALEHSSDGARREGFFIDLLARHYSRDEARAQLETAIDWGRYAELFEYDAGHGEIRLHVHSEQAMAR